MRGRSLTSIGSPTPCSTARARSGNLIDDRGEQLPAHVRRRLELLIGARAGGAEQIAAVRRLQIEADRQLLGTSAARASRFRNSGADRFAAGRELFASLLRPTAGASRCRRHRQAGAASRCPCAIRLAKSNSRQRRSISALRVQCMSGANARCGIARRPRSSACSMAQAHRRSSTSYHAGSM